MPVETASYITQLNPAYPLLSDTVESLGPQTNLIKSVLQTTFPNLSAAMTATAAALNIAAGAFNGSTLTIPSSTAAGQLVLTAPAAGNTITLSTGTAAGTGLVVTSQAPTSGGVTPAPVTEITTDGAGNVTVPKALAASTLIGSVSVSTVTLNTTTLNATTVNQNGVELVPAGIICMWSGAATAIPAGWFLCNGSNGTPNLQNKFIVGAGGTYAVGATGGATTAALAIANLPAHNHPVNDAGHTHAITDPGHNHAVVDPGHNHYVNDPGHNHNYPGANWGNSGGGPGSEPASSSSPSSWTGTTYGASTGIYLNGSTTGISVSAHATGITNNANTTGITIGNTGTGTAFGIMPPYYALCLIMKA